jgi:dienelactone hydrolase
VEVGSPPLPGTLTLPDGQGPFPSVVLLSGSGPNDQDETIGPNKPFRDIALGLAARGVASIRYDKRTHAYPQSFSTSGTPIDEYVPDALAAISLLERRPETDPRRIFVLGHSQGGTYAPLVAQRAPQVAGVILAAAGVEHLGAAMLRQMRYLATLPGQTGAGASAQLPQIERLVAVIDDATALQKVSSGTNLLGGAGPAYFLAGLRYDPIATARALPQPLLLLQGGRDYQVTVPDDFAVLLKGLKGRDGVNAVQFAQANHLFINGSGAPNPDEYQNAGHVAPAVIAAIATWVKEVGRR